ncbi:oxygen-dependent tRNA uridine(34) hydroxylase TrhO [Nitratireductor indicus]|uniref:oxygen-dependent tRNA uridine(34) hydroxylase TrhO n=1 Tax=Nitratireductor indicus TaxID=721133 RepID=UPI0028743F0A|nr:rhodanese-related sulfurtransferase [Nitratireductor indicus]MDS1137893.1 rhodanese-related sulfurtransferase [Nitratireductor indicus]
MVPSPEDLPVRVAALYRFAALPDHEALRAPLAAFCCERGIRGTLLLAAEGINGTVAGTPDAISSLVAHLEAIPALSGLDVKYSHAETLPFHRMKVRLKKEIVTMGVEGIDPERHAGTYVDPADWNALISDPDTLVVDTRNAYETAIGTFSGAEDPHTETFREFPAWAERNLNRLKGRKVAMFCTGGIRCEKATAFMKLQGVEEVYHLKGGILKYLEEVPSSESLWQGECFVFDERVSVGHGLEIGEASLCRACRHPLTPEERSSPQFEEGVSCPHCCETRSVKDRARYAERQRQVELAEKRGTPFPIGTSTHR